LAWRLVQAGFDVRLVSSVALARTREALHNGCDKNDPEDAQVILHMLRIGATKSYHDPLAHGINDIQPVRAIFAGTSAERTLAYSLRCSNSTFVKIGLGPLGDDHRRGT
jgi:hypothetical protein